MIDRTEVFDLLVKPYTSVSYHVDQKGVIVWRLGTGLNLEILHLKSVEPRKGYGRHLLRTMLERVRFDPPYATVYGFTRSNNMAARFFYEAMGFQLTTVEGVYADGIAVCFSADYKKLTERHLR